MTICRVREPLPIVTGTDAVARPQARGEALADPRDGRRVVAKTGRSTHGHTLQWKLRART